MALLLVQQLAQQKAARAWMATRASESENSNLGMFAELVRGQESQEESHEEAYFRNDSPESVNSKGSSGYTDQRRRASCHQSRTNRSPGNKRHITA